MLATTCSATSFDWMGRFCASRSVRSRPACSERTRSMARRWASVAAHELTEPRDGVVARRQAPQFDERLLRDLLALCRVAHHLQHDAVQQRCQRVVQLGERRLVAATGDGSATRRAGPWRRRRPVVGVARRRRVTQHAPVQRTSTGSRHTFTPCNPFVAGAGCRIGRQRSGSAVGDGAIHSGEVAT